MIASTARLVGGSEQQFVVYSGQELYVCVCVCLCAFGV